MQNTSSLYKELIKQSGRTFRVKIYCTFADGSTEILTDDNIMQNSLVLSSGTSDEGQFSVGCAIISELDFEIENSDGKYDNMSFENAVFDLRIGLVTGQKYDESTSTEWLRKGLYTAEEVTVNENYISIAAYDNMAKLDVPFSDISINYPVKLSELFSKICTYCGIAYGSLNFQNKDLYVNGDYIDEETSCRDIISYIAQLACGYAYIDNVGTCHIGWYENTSYEINEQQKLNGSVTVTGVQLTDTDGNVYRTGTKDYCLIIEDNPLADGNSALQNSVWSDRLIGLELTPFSAEILSDPCIEAGDIVTVSDISGNSYSTLITNIIYRLDGRMTVTCDAETLKENQRTRLSPSAKIIAAARRNTAQQISEYDIRAKQFSELTANAMGYYQTEEIQDDGSVICYQHDKPLLSESNVIWKKSIDSFAVSVDGGKTWKGLDKEANAVLKVLAAQGIVADWITSGSINADLITAGILQGIKIIAATGSIAGWTMQDGVLVSSDGSIKVDSQNNIISIYDVDGDKKLLMSLNKNGLRFWRDNKEIGNIGVTKGTNTNTYGLTFNLVDGDAMTWSVLDKVNNVYINKVRYTEQDGLTVSNNISCNKFGGYTLTRNTWTFSDGQVMKYWGWE